MKMNFFRRLKWTLFLSAVMVIAAPGVFYAQLGALGDKAKAKAVEKLTDEVMKELEKNFTEIVAKEPLSAEAKANIVKKLSEMARPVVNNYVSGAASGKLPNPAELSKTVLNDISPQVQNLVAAALKEGGAIANTAPGTSYTQTAATQQPASVPASTQCFCGTANCPNTATAKAKTTAKKPAAYNNSTPSESVVVFAGNGHKYEVINTSKITWTKASSDCEKRGGYLVTINSDEEQKFIEELLSKHGKSKNYWLGGYRQGKDWQWVTGENFTYSNWMPGEPNNDNGRENKIMLPYFTPPGKSQNDRYKWNDLNNNDGGSGSWAGSMGYICEWD